MIIFDMDGVLVDIKSSWEFVHKAFKADGNENLEKYLQGAFDYQEFMRRDIKLWGHVHINQIKSILNRAPLMSGAKETLLKLKFHYRTAIISSGLSVLAKNLQKELEIDYVYANDLKVNRRGMLTGEGEEVVDLWNKVAVLYSLVKRLGMTTEQCAVIGDSIYDIPLFKAAGFSIAFNSGNERVKESATVSIEKKDLRKILRYFIPE
jgi:phosphoserine phosphatase